ncbi:MAG: hypothetical protein ABIE23_04090 [archaeon]|nr:hypothetical protein [Candidatus Micrarchaeota archaeon]
MSAPIKKFSTGSVIVSVWENSSNKTGDERNFYTVSIDRRYKDNNDEWKSTNSFNVNDVPKAILALQEAFRYLALKE